MKPARATGTSPPRGMETIGLDIGETNKRNLAERRRKKGECPTCGIRTHKIGMFGKKTPINVDGECVAGRCLRCLPLEGYRTRPAAMMPTQSPFMPPKQPIEVGQDIIVDDDDSIMSGITMDAALQVGPTGWRSNSNMEIMSGLDEEEEEEEDVGQIPPPRALRRPEPSIGGEDEFQPRPFSGPLHQSRVQRDSFGDLDPFNRPNMPSRSRPSMPSSLTGSRRSLKQGDAVVRQPSPGRSQGSRRRLSPHRKDIIPSRLPSDIEEEKSAQLRQSSTTSGLRESGSTLSYPAPLMDANDDDKALPNGFRRDLQYYDEEEEEKNEIQAPKEQSLRGHPWDKQDFNFVSNISPRRKPQRNSYAEKSEISFDPNDRGDVMGGGGGSMARHTLSQRERHPHKRISPPHTDLQFIPDTPDDHDGQKYHHRQKHGRKTPSPPRTLNVPAAAAHPGHRFSASEASEPMSQPFDASGSGITNIPGIIRQLASRDADTKIRGEAFRSLADIIWISGDEAKVLVQRNNGIETVVESMWEDIGSGRVQDAAVDLLFALSACSEDGMGRDIFIGGSARSAIDALLISMQTHISLESLQRSGCGALGCLASASKENENVDDGTLSGAVSCVVAAMDAHRKSLDAQKWGLWALYCQCVLSHNAENSQMNLAKGCDEAGGINVIFRAMDINDSDMMALEWGCKLYWSLSFSDEICGLLTESNRAIVMIMKVLRLYQGNLDAETVEEAAYGALANIARVKKTHTWLRESGVIARVFESMDTYHSSEGVNTEICALLANLVESQPLREAVLTYGVEKIFRAMEAFPDSTALHEEALRALLCLSVDCEDGKSKLSTRENLNLIMDAINRHQRSSAVLETGFALVSSLCVGRSTASADLSEVVDPLVMAMKMFPDERKLQEVVCLLLRNLSCRDRELEIQSEDFFSCLLSVMKAQADSDTVQLNLCCVLSNILAGEQGITCTRSDDGMNQIVAVIQTHMESAAVLEMACAVLWHLVASSEECQSSLVQTGGVEYVKTALLMHPSSPPTLEKVCGVLACLSGNPAHARLLAQDQGISYVVETMRLHSTSFVLLEYASIFLRNMVLHNSTEYALEASGGISTILAALKENVSAACNFKVEACNSLWVMAGHAEDSRQKILALDGYEVLLGLMQDDSHESDLRDAARGAFNQISIPSSNQLGMA